MVTPPALVADCVGKSFGERRILSAASLRAVPGQVRVLFGRNGIGKSTLLKIAAGLVRADSGAVHVNGSAYLAPSLPQLARQGLFFLPDHDLLAATLPLGEQLRLYQRHFQRRSVEEAAAIADVTALLDQRPRELSGGELRRAELSLALVRRPSVLLADEPYRGIAPVDHDRLAAVFRAMADDGCAVVVTGHEYEALMELADHVTWCTSGTTYELGAPAQARAHESFGREYALRRL